MSVLNTASLCCTSQTKHRKINKIKSQEEFAEVPRRVGRGAGHTLMRGYIKTK